MWPLLDLNVILPQRCLIDWWINQKRTQEQKNEFWEERKRLAFVFLLSPQLNSISHMLLWERYDISHWMEAFVLRCRYKKRTDRQHSRQKTLIFFISNAKCPMETSKGRMFSCASLHPGCFSLSFFCKRLKIKLFLFCLRNGIVVRIVYSIRRWSLHNLSRVWVPRRQQNTIGIHYSGIMTILYRQAKWRVQQMNWSESHNIVPHFVT